MNKKTYSFIAIAILLSSSFIPVAENVVAKASNDKTIEIPIQIYTLQGVKEIKKELPLKEATKLKEKAYEAAKAIETLHDKNASFMEKIKANEIIDSFLYEMKKNGLLGGMSVKEVKELITGKYLEKQKNIETKKLKAIANLFQKNGWEVNAMCGIYTYGLIDDIYPWNLFLRYLNWCGFPFIEIIAGLLWTILDTIPHPTTIGYWLITRAHPSQECGVHTIGLFGIKSLANGKIKAWLFGFSGIVVFHLIAIGFCPFIAFKGTNNEKV